MTLSVRWAFGSFFFLYFAYVGLISPFASLYFLDKGFSAIEIAVLMSIAMLAVLQTFVVPLVRAEG